MLVVETQTTTEDLLEGGTLAAEAGESAFAVSEEEHVAETAGNGLVYRFVKRAFDIAFSLCVVVVGLAPIALLLLIIRLESPGSPIYRQERIGYRGQPLRIFKLRTMVADSDDVEKHLSPEQLAQWRSERKVEDDPRVTRVGRFLRRTSLDELPQFLNVLAGQMSVMPFARCSRSTCSLIRITSRRSRWWSASRASLKGATDERLRYSSVVER